MGQEAVFINKKTEAWLYTKATEGESLASVAGRMLKEAAEKENKDKLGIGVMKI